MFFICQEKTSFKDNAIVWSNILLVIVTLIYASLTYFQLGVSKQQLILDRRPYISFESLIFYPDIPSSTYIASDGEPAPTPSAGVYKINNLGPQIRNLGKSFAYFSVKKIKLTLDNKFSFEPKFDEWKGILAPQGYTTLPFLESPIEFKQFPLTGTIEYVIEFYNSEQKDVRYASIIEFEFILYSLTSSPEIREIRHIELPE